MDQLRGPVERLSFNLYRAATEVLDACHNPEERDQSFVVGAFAASTAAAYIYLGSNGTTEAHLERVLHLSNLFENRVTPELVMIAFRQAVAHVTKKVDAHFPLADAVHETGFNVHLANKCFFRDGHILRPEFHDSILSTLGTEFDDISNLDRGSLEEVRIGINEWVCKNTGGKVKEMLGAHLSEGTKRTLTSNMFMINASSMRGLWQNPFPTGNTTDAPFHLPNGKTITVPMMHLTAQVPYAEDPELHVQYIEIPYAGNEASLCIMIPKPQESKFGKLGNKSVTLPQVENKLSFETFMQLSMRKRMRNVDIQMPRFKIENSFDLKDLFVRVGMKSAFQPDADFSKMVENPRFHLTGAIHKVTIEFNEYGTISHKDVDSGSSNSNDNDATPGAAGDSEPPNNNYRPRSASNSLVDPARAAKIAEARRATVFDSETFIANRPFMFSIRHNQSGLVLFVGRFSSYHHKDHTQPSCLSPPAHHEWRGAGYVIKSPLLQRRLELDGQAKRRDSR